jgi:leader peptidase (prepilin peptidase) / N-methyltransferase
MDADAVDIRRIDVDDEISVWVPAAPAPDAIPSAPSAVGIAGRAWRVRPVGLALGGVLGCAALLRVGTTPAGVLAAAVLAVLGVLAVIDLEWRVLPNKIVLPAIAGVLAWQLAFFPGHFVEALVAAVGAAVFLILPSLFRPGAIGIGDVKVAALLGAALGAPVAVALAVGSLAAWPVAFVLVLRGASVRGATIPFGPFLALGGAVMLLA